MPVVEANSQLCCYVGDLSLAAAFGDRRDVSIAVSDQYVFNKDQLAIRGTERFDVNVHDIGDYNATAASRTPGPLSVLLTASA
jgi:HK97 family phage major capsid protein